MRNGGIGGSLFLVALGAILYWAVSVEAEGFNINTIGLILMMVGAVGVVLTLIMTADSNDAERGRDVTVIDRQKTGSGGPAHTGLPVRSPKPA